MSLPLQNQQIREFAPQGNQIITFGAAVQVVNWDNVLPQNTDLLSFGLSELVTTVAVNDPLTAVWITNISITVNGTFEIVRDFTRAEYINIVQNLESKEADIISNGNHLFKSFKPALPKGTRVQISITVNTLALGLTTPAATAIGRAVMNAYDTRAKTGNSLVIYQRISQFPTPVGVVLNQPVEKDLGTEIKTVKFLIIREFTVAVLTDTFTSRMEISADGNPIARIQETVGKKHYSLIADGLAVPVGYRMFKLPGRGWNAAQAKTLVLKVQAHTTVATGSWDGFQVLVKTFV